MSHRGTGGRLAAHSFFLHSACIFFGVTATEITLLSAMEDLEIIPAATSALGSFVLAPASHFRFPPIATNSGRRGRSGSCHEQTLPSSNPNIILRCAVATLMTCIGDPAWFD
jgi:hypothetical protein